MRRDHEPSAKAKRWMGAALLRYLTVKPGDVDYVDPRVSFNGASR